MSDGPLCDLDNQIRNASNTIRGLISRKREEIAEADAHAAKFAPGQPSANGDAFRRCQARADKMRREEDLLLMHYAAANNGELLHLTGAFPGLGGPSLAPGFDRLYVEANRAKRVRYMDHGAANDEYPLTTGLAD